MPCTEPSKKKLYLNGELICEYDSIGDENKDNELCIQLLKDRGLYRPTTPLQSIFRQARSFANAAAYLYERDLIAIPRRGESLAPFVVNIAFSIELYLKMLASSHGIEIRGHGLRRLFSGLPESAVVAIKSKLPREGAKAQFESHLDFSNALERAGSCFVDWRYLHENGRSSTVYIQELVLLAEVLHDCCKEQLDQAETP